MPKTTVINIHRESSYDVYIGRPSKWGNPFSHTPGATHLVSSRHEAVLKYSQFIRSRPDLIAAAKWELKGKVLGCFCKPMLCHGDVLAKIAEEP